MLLFPISIILYTAENWAVVCHLLKNVIVRFLNRMQSLSRQTGSLNCVRFSLYTDDEIRKLSVKCIRNPQTFDHFGNPTYGGLYDPALGPADRDDVCTTCGQGSMYCPGHFGHIELKLPVYHPLFMKLLVTILRSTCFQCHKVDVEKAAICLLQRYELNMIKLSESF